MLLRIADTDGGGQALDVRWDLTDSVTLQSLTGYREMYNKCEADSDGSPLNLILSTRDVQENEALSQEFRLLGTACDAWTIPPVSSTWTMKATFTRSDRSRPPKQEHRRLQERGLGHIRAGHL